MSSTPAEIRRIMTSALIAASTIGQTEQIVEAIYKALEAKDMLDVEKPDEKPDLFEKAISGMPDDQQRTIRAEIDRIGKQAFATKLLEAMIRNVNVEP